MTARATDDLAAGVETAYKLDAGIKSGVLLTLRHNGFPLFWDTLAPVDGARIHVHALDPAMTDYQHEHPVRKNEEGKYSFFFLPRSDCSYRLWAHVHFKDGTTRHVRTDIPGQQSCADVSVIRDTSPHRTARDYGFTLHAPAAPRVGEDITVRVHVDNPHAAEDPAFPFLEPLAGGFAQMIAVYDDYETLTVLEPLDEPPGGRHDRGGPDISFRLHPAQPGFVRLFLRTAIDGVIHTVPFDIEVLAAE